MAADQNSALGLPDMSSLNEEERQQVIAVMKRAKDFEVQEENKLRQPLEGQLSKYTNVVKGWQHRWFALDPDSGMLEYYEKEEYKSQRPRGSVHLAAAVISPSDEDSQTFLVNAANGEAYRLRALDARERQHWVNRLRATAEYHTNTLAQKAPPLHRHYENRPYSLPDVGGVPQVAPLTPPQSRAAPPQPQQRKISGSQDGLHINSSVTTVTRSPESLVDPSSPSPVANKFSGSQHKSPSLSSVPDNFKSVKEMLSQVHAQDRDLTESIEELPPTGSHINSLDKDMLILKATSNATIHCLEQCLSILQQQQQVSSNQSCGLPAGATVEWLEPKSPSGPRTMLSPSVQGSIGPSSLSRSESFASVSSNPGSIIDTSRGEVVINGDDEVEDQEEYTDTELGEVEEHKSVILHLLSQLKLGMDLTKVVLPTFILEKRSLLEMFADCMAHPDLFLRVPDLPDPQSRMVNVLQWYLTSFHNGRKAAVAKKPYNPIIGERFHCSWSVPASSSSSGGTAPGGGATADPGGAKPTRLTYCAEQVSHHPPISAFYFECPEKKMCMNASIWTKSKFMGMSIGVAMVGKVCLNLLSLDEKYEFMLPSAYARSILTVPWMELGDKVTINCRKTGYSSSIIFHTKPFYGGKLHHVTSEVKNPAGEIVARMNGEWNGQMELSYANGRTMVIDTRKMEMRKKRVRPLNMQADFESRKLWYHVTKSLELGDINVATEHKKYLEDRQRQGERHRKETGTSYPTKMFHLEGDTWTYNKILTRASLAKGGV